MSLSHQRVPSAVFAHFAGHWQDWHTELVERQVKQAVTLVLASKYFSAEQLWEAWQAGWTHFGENRVQDLLSKQAYFETRLQNDPLTASLAKAPPLWELIGHLQANKVLKVVGAVQRIQSIDSWSLAQKVHQRAMVLGVQQRCLLQVNLSGEPAKEGFTWEGLNQHFEGLTNLAGLVMEGFMGMSGLLSSEAKRQEEFASLRVFRDNCQRLYGRSFPELSMGMSEDYPLALGEGATIVRLGRRFMVN
jgi:PLP dependent protein